MVNNMVRENAKKTFIFVTPVVLILLLSLVTPGLTQAEDVDTEENDYIIRAPIRIDGNDDFAEQAAAEGWVGDGSEGDPYIISGYIIDSRLATCVDIENTSVHFKLIDNHLYGGIIGIHLVDVRNGIISGNIVSDKRESLVSAGSEDSSVDINTVKSDKIYDQPPFRGIVHHRSESNIIIDNHISNKDTGIGLLYSNNNTVVNNTVSNCGVGGISVIYDSHNNTIANNTISSTSIGLDVDGTNNTVVNNILFDNYISLSLRGSYNTISKNTISNSWRGIIIRGNNNVIYGNILSANTEWGIYARGNNNLFYQNRFIDNEGQAYDEGDNRWDNGDPAEGGDGGNYWSDYEGENRGDGIGDISYDIEGNDNRDNYPWIIEQPEDDGDILSDHLQLILIAVISIIAILAVIFVVWRKRA